jgi:putative transposase
MITEKALYRARVLAHEERYGMEAVIHAFEVKERTLYAWKQRFEEGGKKLEALNDKSRAPQKKRRRIWPEEVVGEIKRLRWVYPNLGGEKLYDLYTRYAFAWATTSHASKAATEFFDYCRTVFPFPFEFQYVLTDTGSEFKKHFDEEVRRLHMTHYHTYPKTPKMNAHVERFNRTLQEDFADYHLGDLLYPEVFNKKLIEWPYTLV